MSDAPIEMWPALPYREWGDTCATLHLWTQVVGKVRVALTPWENHSWHVPLYVTARGLTTSPIPYDARSFQVQFDFIAHSLDIEVSDGSIKRIPLKAQSVADFYAAVMDALSGLGIRIAINQKPCEIPDAIPFNDDKSHASYDAEYANRFWRVLLAADRVLKRFRTGFIGKCSPVHFFWGSFDLAVTRFSGRRAPLFAGQAPGVSAQIMQEAYSHEVSSAGFWPGGPNSDAVFYSYAYPPPDGFKEATVRPSAAHFSEALGEFVLPYDAVRRAVNPEGELLDFLQTTYEAAAGGGSWDRSALESPQGVPGVCRDPQALATK